MSTSIPKTELCQALAQALDDMQLDAQPQAELNDDAMVWDVALIPGVRAQLMLQRTSYDDHALTLVTSSYCAHDAERWNDLDAFAEIMGALSAPTRLIRLDEELGMHLAGRAWGAALLVDLLVELVALQRYALVTTFDAWVALARGECDVDSAALRLNKAIENSRTSAQVQGGTA
ncbi:hypothetical protein [Limnohabitans sp. 2KL-3]|uniref:hypothetical protein n=1 Tax=Limnohabitans sp. 2KL-3 TaxID=1100700 RepID=UPI000AF0D96E|nr:hypothetical protein [Limnohabitans sp. 2KL-3]